ncbi:hypothetical protein HDU98_011926 [Podochytrium sp. JEL0797]|nr:hypothetical protein HDU98_011926 [Podochytrium sp. JEL0797]
MYRPKMVVKRSLSGRHYPIRGDLLSGSVPVAPISPTTAARSIFSFDGCLPSPTVPGGASHFFSTSPGNRGGVPVVSMNGGGPLGLLRTNITTLPYAGTLGAGGSTKKDELDCLTPISRMLQSLNDVSSDPVAAPPLSLMAEPPVANTAAGVGGPATVVDTTVDLVLGNFLDTIQEIAGKQRRMSMPFGARDSRPAGGGGGGGGAVGGKLDLLSGLLNGGLDDVVSAAGEIPGAVGSFGAFHLSVESQMQQMQQQLEQQRQQQQFEQGLQGMQIFGQPQQMQFLQQFFPEYPQLQSPAQLPLSRMPSYHTPISPPNPPQTVSNLASSSAKPHFLTSKLSRPNVSSPLTVLSATKSPVPNSEFGIPSPPSPTNLKNSGPSSMQYNPRSDNSNAMYLQYPPPPMSAPFSNPPPFSPMVSSSDATIIKHSNLQRCPYGDCKKSFKLADSLSAHMVAAHGLAPAVAMAVKNGGSGGERSEGEGEGEGVEQRSEDGGATDAPKLALKCNMCDQTFSRSHALYALKADVKIASSLDGCISSVNCGNFPADGLTFLSSGNTTDCGNADLYSRMSRYFTENWSFLVSASDGVFTVTMYISIPERKRQDAAPWMLSWQPASLTSTSTVATIPFTRSIVSNVPVDSNTRVATSVIPTNSARLSVTATSRSPNTSLPTGQPITPPQMSPELTLTTTRSMLPPLVISATTFTLPPGPGNLKASAAESVVAI